MRESAVDANTNSTSRSLTSSDSAVHRHDRRAPSSVRSLEPVEFARWVEEREVRLAERWFREVTHRGPDVDPEQAELLKDFFALFVSMLPATLGPYREQVEPLWGQAAQLFGSVAAQRGLAAGEVIEEFQVLREGVIRLLYAEPPVAGGARMTLRDILRINRVIDRGVTQASVGHTDVLFFALFQGSGVPETLDDEILSEIRFQLDSIEREFRSVMKSLRP